MLKKPDMKRIIIFTGFFIFLFHATAFAQDLSIKAEVDKVSLTTDETLTYKITVNLPEKKIPILEMPKFKGFNIISSVQSSTASWVKGGMKKVIVYAYILVPVDIGKFKIEPAIIKIKNTTYSTDAFEIEVKQGKAKPKTPSQEKPLLPEEIQSESEQPQITL